MATTVYNGKGNITHTNSSGGNQRIIIYWINKDNSDVVDVKWGNLAGNHNTASLNTNVDQYVGLNLAHGMSSTNSQSCRDEKTTSFSKRVFIPNTSVDRCC